MTDFGKIVKIIRNGESLRAMAKKLSISPAFLSAMEVGRKLIPMNYCQKISSAYCLSIEQEQELYDAICKTNGHIDININEMTTEQKEICMRFAKKIVNANKEQIEKIGKVLSE